MVDDPCAQIPVIDKVRVRVRGNISVKMLTNNLQLNADKPGVVEYETDIGDSGEL